jgi:hypothetical protein
MNDIVNTEISKLVTFGCSFTYGHGLPDCIDKDRKNPGPHPSQFAWPALIAKNIGVFCENKSSCGSSNLEILTNILNTNFDPNDLVVVMWSFVERDCILEEMSIIKIGHWSIGKTFKTWLSLHPRIDLIKRSWTYLHHADCYIKSKGICPIHVFVRSTDFNNTYKPRFVKDITTYHEIDGWSTLLIDRAIDKNHPGINAHHKMASYIQEILRGAT